MTKLTENELSKIMQTSLRIDRNFDCCPLLGGPVQPLPVQWKEDIEEKVRGALKSFNENNDGTMSGIRGKYYNLSPAVLEEKEQKEIMEVQRNILKKFRYGGGMDFMVLKDDNGRGFYHNHSENLFVWVNGIGETLFNGEKIERESDQLRIMTIGKSFDIA